MAKGNWTIDWMLTFAMFEGIAKMTKWKDEKVIQKHTGIIDNIDRTIDRHMNGLIDSEVDTCHR